MNLAPPSRAALARPTLPPATVDLSTVGLNRGRMTLSSFSVPSQAPMGDVSVLGRNPFGAPETRLTERAEVALLVPSYAAAAPPGDLRILEDETNGEAPIPQGTSPDAFGQQVRAVAAGNLDGDGEEELIFAVAAGGGLSLRVFDERPDGLMGWTELVFTSTSLPLDQIEIVTGDFDGDKRDEIAVTLSRSPHVSLVANRTYMWVYDDPQEACRLMAFRYWGDDDGYGSHASYRMAAGDVDADGRDELVLVRRGIGFDSQMTLLGSSLRMSLWGWSETSDDMEPLTQQQPTLATPFNLPANAHPVKIVIGQFDDDEAEEVLVTTPYARSGGMSVELFLYDHSGPNGSFHLMGRGDFAALLNGDPYYDAAYDVCAVDRFGQGRDDIALFRKVSGGLSIVDCLRYDQASDAWTAERVFDDVATYSVDTLTVRAADTDANGAEELYASYCWGSGDYKAVWVFAIEDGPAPTNRRIASYGSNRPGPTVPLTIVPLDLDADGFEVRYTGVSEYVVSNPVPLTLMAAVPTKAGISQNTDFSGTSYSVGSGTGVETSLITSTTITAKLGADWEDISGLFGASAKATFARETSTTNTVSSRTTFVTGYTGAYDDDVIVFAAHLYLTHEYEIVSAPDPGTIGALFTIDQPVDTNVYKWTVPFYNASVNPDRRIDTDLLGHTIGDPRTYRTRSQMQQHTSGFVGWASQGGVTVGQGNGFNRLEIDLEFENATTEQEVVELGAEASFKAWGASVEGSFSAGDGSAYTVSTNGRTVYEGVVGDIADHGEYQLWNYEWGMAVYHPWRLSDLFNNPTGSWLPGGYPLTVIDFWVDPTGTGY